MTDQHKPLRDAQLIQADAVRAIAVEAIRSVTGCADISRDGNGVVDEMERVARVAARIAPPEEYMRLLSERDQLAAEVGRLTACLKTANSQAEHFERQWYLRGDEVEALRADAERYRWLRKNVTGGPEDGAYVFPAVEAWIGVVPRTPVWIDAAIDSARKE